MYDSHTSVHYSIRALTAIESHSRLIGYRIRKGTRARARVACDRPLKSIRFLNARRRRRGYPGSDVNQDERKFVPEPALPTLGCALESAGREALAMLLAGTPRNEE